MMFCMVAIPGTLAVWLTWLTVPLNHRNILSTQPKMSLVLLMVLLPLVSGMYQPPRLNMIQRQSCYYVPYSKQLTCQCTGENTNTFLNLRLMFFIKEKSQEVRSVMVESCLNLLIGLDLSGINPTKIPFKFKNCGRVSFDSINFDPRFAGSQLLSIDFETVNSVMLEGLSVEEAVQISTTKVKELIIHQSNFTHLPLPGLIISQTDKLSVTDSLFTRISPGSISVKSAKEVVVVNNQFNINAIQVVRSNEGSSLYISCNRLLGVPGSPECVPTSTSQPSPVYIVSTPSTIPTTITTSSLTTITTNTIWSESHSSIVSLELLIGLVVGVCLLVIFLFFIVMYLCCKRKKKEQLKSKKAEIDEEKVEIVTEKDADKDSGNNSGEGLDGSEEIDSLLMPETPEEEPEHLVEVSKPRFSSPIWLDEIHNNKIFNKQRSIINTETLVNTPNRPGRPFPVRSISEIIEPESESEDDNTGIIVDEQSSEAHEVNQRERDNRIDKPNIKNGTMEEKDVKHLPVPETNF